MRRRTLCAVAVLLLLGWVTDAAAHVPELRGRLVDLVGRSDAIAVGTMTSSVPVDKRLNRRLFASTPSSAERWSRARL